MTPSACQYDLYWAKWRMCGKPVTTWLTQGVLSCNWYATEVLSHSQKTILEMQCCTAVVCTRIGQINKPRADAASFSAVTAILATVLEYRQGQQLKAPIVR